MQDAAIAVVHALFLWWFGTGIVLYLDGLPRRTFRWTVAGASVLAALALVVIAASRDESTVLAAHLAFAAALFVWAWNEVLFLTGTVTGPRRGPRPAGDRGWRRFRNAAETILHHELVLAASGVAILAMTWGADNQVATWTFATLWTMRLSTKLNVFLGVRNLGEAFLPDHLAYLATYFRRAPMNPLLPWSVIGSLVLLAVLAAVAVSPGTAPFEAAGATLVATLVALAIVEHGFLVLPFDAAGLWRWGFRSRTEVPSQPAPAFGTPRPERPSKDNGGLA